MLHGFHVILAAYGFWLPNDPRGSWSDFVGRWELLRFGKATKVTTTRSLAREPHDRALRLAAKQALMFPPVRFTGKQTLAVATGFGRAALEGHYSLLACAVLPEHAQLVIGRHERNIRRIAGHLRARATQQLHSDGLWSNSPQPVWGQRPWAVYLNSIEDMRRAIGYVERNPEKEGKRRQKWSFVTGYAPNALD
jgi:hypothetical protein